jgi:hypothetical protein
VSIVALDAEGLKGNRTVNVQSIWHSGLFRHFGLSETHNLRVFKGIKGSTPAASTMTFNTLHRNRIMPIFVRSGMVSEKSI